MEVKARDGHIGRISDLYFDDRAWKLKYLVVDIGSWLIGRKVLLSPQAVDVCDLETRSINLNVTKLQVEQSPDASTDAPIALQHEIELHSYYGWSPIFAGEVFIGTPPSHFLVSEMAPAVNSYGGEFDPHLRSTRLLSGIDLFGYDGLLGTTNDLVLDTESWEIDFVSVNLGRGRCVLIRPSSIRAIDVEDGTVRTDLSIWTMRELPAFYEGRPAILCVEQEETVGAHTEDARL